MSKFQTINNTIKEHDKMQRVKSASNNIPLKQYDEYTISGVPGFIVNRFMNKSLTVRDQFWNKVLNMKPFQHYNFTIQKHDFDIYHHILQNKTYSHVGGDILFKSKGSKRRIVQEHRISFIGGNHRDGECECDKLLSRSFSIEITVYYAKEYIINQIDRWFQTNKSELYSSPVTNTPYIQTDHIKELIKESKWYEIVYEEHHTNYLFVGVDNLKVLYWQIYNESDFTGQVIDFIVQYVGPFTPIPDHCNNHSLITH